MYGLCEDININALRSTLLSWRRKKGNEGEKGREWKGRGEKKERKGRERKGK